MKIHKVLLHLFLLIAISGCLDRLDLIGDTEQGQLVIYGLLTDLNEGNKVEINLTAPFGLRPVAVTHASVFLLTENDGFAPYFHRGNGIYELFFYQPEPGKRYAIEVRIDEEVFRSEWSQMPLRSAVDALEFEFNLESFRNQVLDPVFTVSSNVTLPSDREPIYLRWQAEETYIWLRTTFPCTGLCPYPPDPCYINDNFDPNRITLFSNQNASGQRFSQVMGKRFVDNSFLTALFVNVTQLSITPEAFEYWQRIQAVVSNQGGLFDAPPSRVVGNVYNVENPEERVLGYFEVAKARVTRIYTTGQNVPIFLSSPCQFFSNRSISEYPAECRDCEARARGRKWTNVRPEWWKFD
jgi:hypothetical protein